MAGAAGPNTAESGLVFAYDLGNTLTSYIGEPTTNEANTNYFRTIQFHNQGAYGNAGYILDAPERGPDWKKIIVTDRGNNFRIAQFPYISQNYGTTKVYSVEYDFGGTSGYFIYGDGSSGFGVLQDDGKRVTARFTPPSAGSWSEALFLGNNTPASGIYDIIYYRNYQVEVNSHPTQFTPSSRSATQGLLNLTGNGVINITNASFNSNAQLLFDGTNDLIFTADSTYLDPGSSPFSIELLFNCSNVSVGEGILYNKEDLYETAIHGGVFQYAWQPHWAWDGDSTFPVSSNTWYHAVVTYDGSYQRMYKNGVEVYNRAQSGNMGSNSNVLSMGARGVDGNGGSGYNFFPGQIPVVKAYKAALTAAEVQQNYQALRSRFGI